MIVFSKFCSPLLQNIMQDNGSGEAVTPFSKYVDHEKMFNVVKSSPQAASPSTVTKIISLPASQTKRSLKGYLREKLFAANHDIRSVLFKTLVRRIGCNASMFGEDMFMEFVAEHFSDRLSGAPMLPNFVDQSEGLPVYYLNQDGQLELKKILACIGFHFPHITYCPILPVVVSLFLHYDDNSCQVFVHTCRLMFSNSKQIHYMDQTKTESDASSLVLKELCLRYTSTSHKSLLNLTSDPDGVYTYWIKCLFHYLPFTFIVVLFDMYLLEGYKALYRVSLAILKLYRKVGVSDPTNIVNAVFDFVKSLDSTVSVQTLFRKAFSFKFPPSKDIKKMHRKFQSPFKQAQLPQGDVVHCRNPWDYVSLVKDVKSNIVNDTLLSTLYCWLPETVALNSPVLLFSTDANGYSLQTFFTSVEYHEPTLLLVKTTSDEVIGAYLSSPWHERLKGGFFGTGETFIFSLLPEEKVYRWCQLKYSSRLSSSCEHSPRVGRKRDKGLPPVKPPVESLQVGRTVTLPPINLATSQAAVPSPRTPDPVILPPLVGSAITTQPQVKQLAPKADMFIMANDSGIMIGGGGNYGIFIDRELRRGTSSCCTTFNNQPLINGEAFTCACVEVFSFDCEIV